MAFKDQLAKFKDNWFIVLLVVLLLLFMIGGSSTKDLFGSLGSKSLSSMEAYDSSNRYFAPQSPGGGDFAPEQTERIITKSSSLSAEVERGSFQDAEQRIKSIAADSKSIILSQNSNRYGEGNTDYYNGNYQIKVPVDQYDAVVGQLKGIGKVKSFNENTQDITGQVLSIESTLAAERERLARYQKMLDESTRVEDKLTVTDRIYTQERTIKYLEEQQTRNDQRIEYSTVSVSLAEKQSNFYGIGFVRFGDLAKTLVNSCNMLLYALAFLLPWALVYGIYRLIKSKARK